VTNLVQESRAIARKLREAASCLLHLPMTSIIVI